MLQEQGMKSLENMFAVGWAVLKELLETKIIKIESCYESIVRRL